MKQPEDLEEVISRVRKLLLKHDGCKKVRSEHEAKAALDLAYRLVEKHHLNMSDILITSLRDSIEIIDEECEKYIANKMPYYLTRIVEMVNLICNTKCILRKYEVNRSAKLLSVNFVGEKSDVDRSVKIYKFFKKTIHALANQHRRSINGNFTNWRSYAEGFSDRLCERARDLILERNKRVDNFKDTKIDSLCESTELTNKQELQVYNYRQKVMNQIQEYLNNIAPNAKIEKLKYSKDIDQNSYCLGRIKADEYRLNANLDSNQVLPQKDSQK